MKTARPFLTALLAIALWLLLALPLTTVLALWIASRSTARSIDAEVEARPAIAPGWSKWRPPPEQADSLMLAAGGVEWRHDRLLGPPAAALAPRTWSLSTVERPLLAVRREPRPSVWNRLGFYCWSGTPGGSYFHSVGGRTAWSRIVDVPWWCLAMLAALPPAVALARRRRRRARLRVGRCRNCGYDLRATPDVCPECGTRATAPANAIRKAAT